MTYLAEFESAHFSFRATGETEADARAKMAEGLTGHARQCGIPVDWFDPDDFNVTKLQPSGFWRDGSLTNFDPAPRGDL